MTNGIGDIRALPLHDLIAGPLVAVIQADAQAAKATLEYIETVGFAASAADQQGSDENIEAGHLRMAEFRYRKLDENGEVAEFVASVPVLSLVPIPALQVRDAKLKLSANITEITREQVKAAAVRPGSPVVRQLQPTQYRLLARPTAASGARDKEVRGTFHLEFEISLEQADLPLGLEKIFNLMDQAIQDRKVSSEG